MVFPYLLFEGNCEEAFRWYEKVFGGRIQHMPHYSDVPESANMRLSCAQKKMVMHAQMSLTETGGISGADSFEPVTRGNAVSVQVHYDKSDDAIRVFAALKEGGSVICEMMPNPPPDHESLSGMVTDKYGVTWVLSCSK